MDGNQINAFSSASGVSHADVLLVIALVASALYLTWLGWVAYGQFRSWHDDRATLLDFMWVVIRAAIIVLLIGFFVRP